jgi:hypothetical protein
VVVYIDKVPGSAVARGTDAVIPGREVARKGWGRIVNAGSTDIGGKLWVGMA